MINIGLKKNVLGVRWPSLHTTLRHWATYLELISVLSIEVFIAAFKRFVFRSSKFIDIYSNCGISFVRPKCKFTRYEKLAKSNKYNECISNHLANIGISWNYNFSGASHMGGLRRLKTLLAQVDTFLDSRLFN